MQKSHPAKRFGFVVIIDEMYASRYKYFGYYVNLKA